MYRLVLGLNKVLKFDTYSEALENQQKYGGILYQKIGNINCLVPKENEKEIPDSLIAQAETAMGM